MQTQKAISGLAAILMLVAVGCDSEDARLAEMAQRHVHEQAEQNKRMADLQKEVAQGARELVEADAQSREQFVAMHRDAQAERAEIGLQRDALEAERREIATQRHRDPVIAAAILNIGLLLACMMPLVVCWYLLQRKPEPEDPQLVAEVLLEDLMAEQPLLLPARRPALGYSSDDPPALDDELSDRTQ